jgi:hypothetical protein
VGDPLRIVLVRDMWLPVIGLADRAVGAFRVPLNVPDEPNGTRDLLVHAARRWKIRHVWTNYLHEALDRAPLGQMID